MYSTGNYTQYIVIIYKGKNLGKNIYIYTHKLHTHTHTYGASQAALVIKNLPANAGGIRDMGSIPSLGRDPEEGHGNPLQCSRLENPMNRGAWWAMVHGSQGVGHD